MLKKIGSALKKLGSKAKIAAGMMSVAAVTAITTVVCAAEETTSNGNVSSSVDFAAIAKSAGTVLESALSNLVTSLTPVLITVAVSGLGLYAVSMLFRVAKKLFEKAAG